MAGWQQLSRLSRWEHDGTGSGSCLRYRRKAGARIGNVREGWVAECLLRGIEWGMADIAGMWNGSGAGRHISSLHRTRGTEIMKQTMKKTNYIVPAALVIFILYIGWPYARIHPDIQAAPFAWPAGCENKVYHKGDAISYSCIVKSYQFQDALKYHLSRDGRSADAARWYRVGNDLLWIDCLPSCAVYDAENNVFHQEVGK